MFQKILVATGGSPWSKHAVDAAIRLAASLKLEIVVTHILEDDPQYQPPGLNVADPQLRQEMEATGQQIVFQAGQRATQARVSHRTVMRWGGIPEEIIQVAHDEQCDLIVMGTRHLIGEKRLMTGRICNAVVATAPCPVLIVPLVH